jgi:hypothetical protein
MPIQLDYTVIAAHEPRFAVVIVPKPVLNDTAVAEQTRAFLEQQYFHLPTVLMARDDRGIPNTYYGRGDLAIPLSRVPLASRPWEHMTLD